MRGYILHPSTLKSITRKKNFQACQILSRNCNYFFPDLYLTSEIPHQNKAFNPEGMQRLKKQTWLPPLEQRRAV